MNIPMHFHAESRVDTFLPTEPCKPYEVELRVVTSSDMQRLLAEIDNVRKEYADKYGEKTTIEEEKKNPEELEKGIAITKKL